MNRNSAARPADSEIVAERAVGTGHARYLGFEHGLFGGALAGLNTLPTPRMVQGDDVGQVFQFVASANAQLGFVALAQILNPKNTFSRDYWLVPEGLYDPIEQDMALLKKAQNNSAAHAFVAFMQTARARALIQQAGYKVK